MEDNKVTKEGKNYNRREVEILLEKEWTKVCDRLKNSGYDLSRIIITFKG